VPTMAGMGGQQSATDLARLEDLLRAQWLLLREWVGALEDASLARPSVLPGWTVAELVAHLGRGMDALAAVQPAAPGTVPLSLGEYLGRYPDGAHEIADVTRALAAEIRDAPLPAVDRLASAAFAQLQTLRDASPDPVVVARRGPILLSEMVVSRLIELVVHGDDLLRSTGRSGHGHGTSPLHDDALTLVAEALLEIAVDRGGWQLEIIDRLTWIRLACGRVPYDVDVLTAALQAVHTSDSVPDLGRSLPLL
ncbi:MAG: hypothetical protein JWP95_1973, partial [Actinotalea sp.]|nr:hypothetical protein [Actinotalea sp.]